MNYIIIYATVLLLKLNNKAYRIFLGSLIGAIYAILSVTEIFKIYNSIFIKIIVSIIIMYVSVETKNFKGLIKSVLMFYFVSFTFGGIALALLYFIKPENIMMKNGVYIGTYPIKVVLLGGILGFILVSIVYSIIKNKYSKKKKTCEIEFAIEGKIKKLKALIDSGNFLKEPLTGVPVVVVEKVYLFELVPKKILDNIGKIISGDLEFLNDEIRNVNQEKKSVEDNFVKLDIKDVVKLKEKTEKEEKQNEISKFRSKFRVIPFNSLGKENGLMLGIKGDYLKIIENEEYEHKKIENIIIGLYEKTLSRERGI